MKTYGIRIRCLTPSLKEDNKMIFTNMSCYFNNAFRQYDNSKTFYLSKSNCWCDNYTTDENKIKQYINVNRAIKEAEKQQKLFDRVGNASDVKSKFSVEIVELNFTIRTLKMKKS